MLRPLLALMMADSAASLHLGQRQIVLEPAEADLADALVAPNVVAAHHVLSIE